MFIELFFIFSVSCTHVSISDVHMTFSQNQDQDLYIEIMTKTKFWNLA